MYRYGDGSPFPIQENFIDTLLAAIDACVGTFAVAAELDDRREKTRIARKDAEEELKKLDQLERSVGAAVAPMRPSVEKMAAPSSQAAARALGAAKTAIDGQRSQVQHRLEQLAVEPRVEPILDRARTAVGAFFERHQMPDTAWRWSWNATARGAQGQASAFSEKFRVEYDLDLDGPWKGIVRLGAIAPGLHAQVLGKKMFGGMKKVRIALDRCGITDVEHTPERQVLVMRENVAKPSPGWRVTVADAITLVAVDPTGRAFGAEIVLDGDDAAAFERIAEAVECDFLEMVEDRRRMRTLHVGDFTLDQINDPAEVGRTILGVLGPVVKQIRTKSRVPGELAIKRDIDDGRREELYVPLSDVERRFATLPASYRRPFEEIGLGRQATAEIVSADPEPATIPEAAGAGPRPHTLGRLPVVPPTPLPRIPLRAVP
jgi:hypothetical protein